MFKDRKKQFPGSDFLNPIFCGGQLIIFYIYLQFFYAFGLNKCINYIIAK
jgi:hypothetical protein